MFTSRATVITPTPERYGKQLAHHFARKITVDDIPNGHRAHFEAGQAEILFPGEGLLLVAHGPDLESLAIVQRIVGGHLERFGQRQGIRVEWDDARE